jgi:hypothetical protein
MKTDKDKSDEPQALLSKELDRRHISISHKIPFSPALALTVSLKGENRGQRTNFKLSYQAKLWKSSLALCPETSKTDVTISRKLQKGQIEAGISQTSLEIAYMRQIGQCQLSAGAMLTNQGVKPMLKVSHTIGVHRLSLACGYSSSSVDYYLNYSKGQTRVGLPFRVSLERIEGITFSFFMLGCAYILSQAFSSESRKPRPYNPPEVVILIAVHGPLLEVTESQGKDVSAVIRLLAMGRAHALPFNTFAEQLNIEPKSILRVDFRVNKQDFCALYEPGDLIILG